MSEFTKALIVSPLADGRTWVLLEPFSYDVGAEGSGDTVQVPALFLTDFASVPRPFWAIFPPWGKYGNAAIIHDFGYWSQTRPRAQVDAIFLEGMGVLGVGWLSRHLLYWSVRSWGWLAWMADARRRRKGETMMADHLPEKSTEKKEQVEQTVAPAIKAARMAILIAIALVAACAPDRDDPRNAAAGLVTESDSLRCGSTATLYTNHTANGRDLHVRVTNNCPSTIMPETLIARPARLVVLDARNQVVNNQDVSILEGQTHRGTMTVPGGARLRLECSDRPQRHGCSWSYSYALP